MRGLKRQKQTVYWSRVTEDLDGIDTIKTYQKPELYHLSVSATAGTPEELSAGYIPDYDRYITNFDRSFKPQTADVFWIDCKPELTETGELVLGEDGEPTVRYPERKCGTIWHQVYRRWPRWRIRLSKWNCRINLYRTQ